MKTSKDVAEELGLSMFTISAYARKLDVMKVSHVYLWTDEQIEMVRQRMGMRGKSIAPYTRRVFRSCAECGHCSSDGKKRFCTLAQQEISNRVIKAMPPFCPLGTKTTQN